MIELLEPRTMLETWLGCVTNFVSENVVRNPAMASDEGCLFSVMLDFDNYGYRKDGNTHEASWESKAHLQYGIIVTSRHNVFVRIKECINGEIERKPMEGWENTSNHDSCWREGMRRSKENRDALKSLYTHVTRSVTDMEDFSGVSYHLRHSNFAVPVKVFMEREGENYRRKLIGYDSFQKAIPLKHYINTL